MWARGPGLVLLATLACLGLDGRVQDAAFGMVYLAAVLATAAAAGPGHAVIATLLSFLAWNFLFLPPRYTFVIASAEDVLGVVVFAAVALLLAGGAARLDNRARQAGRRIAAQKGVLQQARRLHRQQGHDALRAAIEEEAGPGARLLLPAETGAQAEAELAAAGALALEQGRPISAAGWQLRPLSRADGVPLAVLAVPPGRQPPDEEAALAFDALCDQAAAALERQELATLALRSQSQQQAEALRATLLSSLAHDLRTPLTAISGAAETLAGPGIDPPTRDDLLLSIRQECARLARWLSAILELVRLEAGEVAPRRETVDLAQAGTEAAAWARRRHPAGCVAEALPRGMQVRGLDEAMLERVLENLLDNALRHGGGNARIMAWREGPDALLAVEDDGPGIPPATLPHVFDAFFRAAQAERRGAGLGLGLAICRGLVDAMGGSIAVQSPCRPDGGTRMTMRFPP